MKWNQKGKIMSKICVMSSVHSAYDTRIYHKEILSLINDGYNIAFLNKEKNGVDDLGIEFIKVNISRNRLKRIFTSSLRMYKLAMEQKANVYHFHDPELLPVGLLLRLKGKEVVYDVHEDVPRQILHKTYLKPMARKLIAFAFERIEKYIAKKLSLVICATPKIESVFHKYECKTICVKNYPKLEEFEHLHKGAEKSKEGVCYLGGIRGDRGIFEMIEAAEKSNTKLKLGGSFDLCSLEQKVRTKKEWANNVVFYGFVDRVKVAEIMNSSVAGLVVLHPTNQYIDSLPIKMFEYMAAGIPVIASNFPLWQKIVDEGECGVCVDPLKPNEIAKVIKHLVKNPHMACEMGEKGKRLIKEKYNWSVEEKKMLKYYNKLFGNIR